MKTIKGLFLAIAGLLLLSSNMLHAEEPPVEEPSYDELIEPFYKSKSEAFEKAKAEGKYVFLMAGRNTCSSCYRTAAAILTEEVQAIIKESYIVWYIDWDYTKRNHFAEGRIYYEAIVGRNEGKNLPATCIIDPEIPEEVLHFDFQQNTIALLISFLSIENRPVANETIALHSNKAYISENTLFISNENSNETITVYTMTGQVVSSFQKRETEKTVDTKAFPKGVLIIKSSAGWSAKLISK